MVSRRKFFGFGIGSLFPFAAQPLRADSLIQTRFEVSSLGLEIKGSLYGRLIPRNVLQVSSARVVDLQVEQNLKPWIKINGVGLPTYRAGWYRTKDWESLFTFWNHGRVVVYIPTTRGYAVLVSPENPQAFLAALQNPTGIAQAFGMAKE